MTPDSALLLEYVKGSLASATGVHSAWRTYAATFPPGPGKVEALNRYAAWKVYMDQLQAQINNWPP